MAGVRLLAARGVSGTTSLPKDAAETRGFRAKLEASAAARTIGPLPRSRTVWRALGRGWWSGLELEVAGGLLDYQAAVLQANS